MITSAAPFLSGFEAIAQVGVGLFIAFGVTVAAVERGSFGRTEHVNWLGFGCGSAFAGLVGIGLCLGLQAYREAGHASWFDLVGLSWAVASLGMLGIAVALGPLMIYRSRESHGE